MTSSYTLTKFQNPLRKMGFNSQLTTMFSETYRVERLEEPHVTVIRKTRAWRFGLRRRDFMDADPPPNEVPREVVDAILANFDALVEAWDRMCPHCPVGGEV